MDEKFGNSIQVSLKLDSKGPIGTISDICGTRGDELIGK